MMYHCGLLLKQQYGDEEEWVENFAYELHNYGDIPQDLETFIQEYKKQIK